MGSNYGDFVVPTMLATPSDLSEWTGSAAPDNALPLLRSATLIVVEATSTAFYDVDAETGIATDSKVKQAMQDAVCIQAASWAAIGYDPLTGGVLVSSVASSKKIGTAAVTYSDGFLASEAKALAINGLVPEAVRKLDHVNLISFRVWTF
jgi:hypothetical protein